MDNATTPTQRAAQEAVTFLFDVQRYHGLPVQVSLTVTPPGQKAQTEELTITPECLPQFLEELQEKSEILVSPFTTEGVAVLYLEIRAESEAHEENMYLQDSLCEEIFAPDCASIHLYESSERRGRRMETVILVFVLSRPIFGQEYYYLHDGLCRMYSAIPNAKIEDYWRSCCRVLSGHRGYPSLSDDGDLFYNFDKIIPINPEDIKLTIARFDAAGRDIEMFRRLGRRSERKDGQERIEWLVEGVIPAGAVTLLAGAQGTGKSTLANELAVAVAQDNGPRKWLGRNIVAENATGIAVILSGEDNAGIINARLEALDPDDTAARIMPYALDARTLPELCEVLAKVKSLSLVIVDPARRYLVGDEDGSDSANTFFATLEALAARTGAAVAVLHHLTKNAAPTSLQAVRELVRGSGVWLDRPRVMLGMYRRRDATMIGVGKHNIPPAYPMMDEGAFTRDAVTLRHLPVAKPDTADDDTEADGMERKALAAIERLRAEGRTVMRTGASELWKIKPPELEGIARNRVRQLVDALIADGLIMSNPAGLEVAP
jgi:energy-coupling factor transporter ATP-binding protein EcfA2